MDTCAIEITTENYHIFEIELKWALGIKDLNAFPELWNTYYLVVNDDGPFLLSPPEFDSRYKFMTPVKNDNLQLVMEI